MVEKNYSQLPVMSSACKVEGMITWKSIGESASRGTHLRLVRECMDSSFKVVCFDDPLLDPTENIAEHGYVLVRGKHGAIVGIIAASDLAQQFKHLAEPFLVIEEIEHHLKALVTGKFTYAEIKSVGSKTKRGTIGLSLSSYRKLLRLPAHWMRLGLDVCHVTFLARLKSVIDIRNDVMHFDPEGPGPEYRERLHEFAGFFRGVGT